MDKRTFLYRAGLLATFALLSWSAISQPVIVATSNRVVKSMPVTLSTAANNYASYVWKTEAGATVGTASTFTTAVSGWYLVTVTATGSSTPSTSAPFELKDQLNGLNRNYIIENTVRRRGESAPGNSSVAAAGQRIDYFDGLGRPLQRVETQASPGYQDLVTPVVYDVVGRQAKTYLPFSSGSDGWYKDNAEALVMAYYAQPASPLVPTDSRPYAEVTFEASPLGRKVREQDAGQAWQTNNRAVNHLYLVNNHSDDGSSIDERIHVWLMGANDLPTRGPERPGYISYYGFISSNQLLITETSNEEGRVVREYFTKSGQRILKKEQVSPLRENLNDPYAWANTYYVYDDRGLLRYVFPPELMTQLIDGGWWPTQEILDNNGLQYQYDARGRMTGKRVPGSDWQYTVYDGRDRVVLTQDGNQRLKNQWNFVKYDALNRPVLTGIKDTAAGVTRAGMQEAVDQHYLKPSARYGETYIGYLTANIHGYTNRAYPVYTSNDTISDQHYLTATYYDGYDFLAGWPGRDYSYINQQLRQYVGADVYEQPANVPQVMVGQVTGTKVKVLDGGDRGGCIWLKTATYYDARLRPVQVVADNFRGGLDRGSVLYDFTGKTLRRKTVHTTADVAWTDMLGTRTIGNRLYRNITNNTWGQSGAASQEVLPAGKDGWVEFTASETTTSRMLGLSESNINAHNNTIGYALYLRDDGALLVREKTTAGGLAVEKAVIPGGYKPGDILRVARTGTAIKYYRNGTEVYPAGATVTQLASATQLVVDVAFANSNATILDVRASFALSEKLVNRRFVYDHADRLKEVYHGLGSRVRWIEHGGTQADITDEVLTKTNTTASWNAGAASEQVIPAGADGWLEVRGVERTTARMIGLATNNTTASYTDIDYAIYLRNNGGLLIYELGQERGVSRTYYTNDIFRVERKGNTVYYKVNDEIIYTSAVTSTTSLRAACSIYTPDATITHAYIGAGTGSSDVLLARHSYNELGQLVDKDLHSVSGTPFRQSVDFRYNIRGWLTSINNAALTTDNVTNADEAGTVDKDYFGMNLAYNTAELATGGTPYYNGNVSAASWSNNQALSTIKQKAYTYQYDGLGRLSGSVFQERTSAAWSAAANGDFAEKDISYNLDGNLQALTRTDGRAAGVPKMDVLTYNYGPVSMSRTNHLLSVTDGGDKTAGFVEGSGTGTDYTYDANGNLTRDLNKGIGNALTDAANRIVYNVLNLPETITKGENTIYYFYDATGRKLAQQVGAGLGMRKTDYVGEFVYEDDLLQYVLHDEGRVAVTSPRLVYTNDFDNTGDVTGDQATVEAVTIDGKTYVKARMTGTARPGLFPIGGGIAVKAGERYKIRARGYRLHGTATSSHPINLRVRINGANDLGWPGALIPEGATAVKTESWIEQTVTIPPGGLLLEAGVAGNSTIAVGEDLFLNAFEIVKLEDRGAEYQYFMKDHVGSVRLTFTTRRDVETALATLEEAKVEQEEPEFIYYDEAVKVNNPLFDHTNEGATTYAARLNGTQQERYGLAKSISVMPGDVIEAEAWAKYIDPASGNHTPALAAFLASIAPGGGAPAGTIIDGGAAGSIGGGAFPLGAFMNRAGDTGTGPKAYMNYLIFDRNMLPLNQGFRRLSATPKENGSDVAHERLQFSGSTAIQIKEPGYIYLYLSYEPNQAGGDMMTEVYFDDFKITHTQSPVVQSRDYYPFGLPFNSYAKENTAPQPLAFNGVETQDALGLETNFTFYRMYDPAIARWWGVDPKLKEDVSGYAAMANNPILQSDPLGDTTLVYSLEGKFLKQIDDQETNQLHYIDEDKFAGMTQGKGENLDEFAKRVRASSVAFIGSNTIAEMKSITDYATENGREIAFVGEVTRSKEIRLTKLPMDKHNYVNKIEIGAQLDKWLTPSNQGILFFAGHVHHAAGMVIRDVEKAAEDLGTPSIGITDDVPYDYYYLLRGSDGHMRPTPGILATPFGMTIFPTIPNRVYSFPNTQQNTRVSYDFFKDGSTK